MTHAFPSHFIRHSEIPNSSFGLNESDIAPRLNGVKLTISTLLLLPALALATPQDEIAAKVPQAKTILDAWQAKDPEKAERKVHIVYWTPADREPAPRYRERLDAIMEDIR